MKAKVKKTFGVRNPWGINVNSKNFWLTLPVRQQKDYRKIVKRMR